MPAMKSVQTAAPGTIKVAEIQRPAPAPRDLLVRVRACGICGTDAAFVQMGGMPLGPDGQTASIPLGHEPAGEVVEIGAEVTGRKAGDRVVVHPQAAPSGIIGCGGTLGGMSEHLLIQNAVAGQSVAVFPDDLPFEVAALNEPMAVARHCVNRSQARTADKVVVFGAGPIGLGAVIWLKLRGVRQVTVADVIPARLRTALAAGADAVIDSSREDVTARLAGLHGHSTNALGAPRPDTDIYIDAAAVVVNTALRAAKWGAKLVTGAMHKKPEPIDLGSMLRSEMTIIASQGYPTEIFEVTPQIAEHQQRFTRLISHRVPFSKANQAFQLALTPGAAQKVVVTFDA
jgi:(R,R)-butanediol dehydrogenase/meso-butanediol dehydrogenase/diacetyl reductase